VIGDSVSHALAKVARILTRTKIVVGACWARSAIAAVFVACGVFASSGCQDGYPIAATQCDDWCHQTRRLVCGETDPAACVAACEKAGVGRPECAELAMLAVQCLQGKTDQELDCETWTYAIAPPCSVEQAAALTCGSAGHEGSAPSTE
jgi:hypothetical protein